MSGPVATPAMMRMASCVSHSARNPSDAASRWRPYPYGYALHELPPLARLLSVLPLIFIIGCGTSGIKPEDKLVSSVTSLPPVQVPVPVRCVKEIPPMPTLTIDPNATVLQRYYAMKALLAAQDEYMLRANAVIQGCAEPKP